jgi:hypothetical protein
MMASCNRQAPVGRNPVNTTRQMQRVQPTASQSMNKGRCQIASELELGVHVVVRLRSNRYPEPGNSWTTCHGPNSPKANRESTLPLTRHGSSRYLLKSGDFTNNRDRRSMLFYRLDEAGGRPWPHSAAAPVLALVHGEPGRAVVGIGHHPGAGRQRPRDDGLAPLEGVFRACRHDG